MPITVDDIKEIISSKTAVSMGLMRPEYAKDWPYVAIDNFGNAHAMRFGSTGM